MSQNSDDITFWSVVGAAFLAFAKAFGNDLYSWCKSFFKSDQPSENKIDSVLDISKVSSIENREMILGVVCTWDQIIGKKGLEEVKDLRFYCPECDTELICFPKQEDIEAPFRRPGSRVTPKLNQNTRLRCENCHRIVFSYDGFENEMRRRFIDQIERLFREKLKQNKSI